MNKYIHWNNRMVSSTALCHGKTGSLLREPPTIQGAATQDPVHHQSRYHGNVHLYPSADPRVVQGCLLQEDPGPLVSPRGGQAHVCLVPGFQEAGGLSLAH